jgi:hypothetical protein
MGQVLVGWQKLANASVSALFNGNDTSIDLLWDIISDGKLIDAGIDGDGWDYSDDDSEEVDTSGDDIHGRIERSFYGFTIPAVWRISQTYAFVLDSGYNCYEEDPVKDYVTKEAMDATSTCYDGRRYYLVYPKEDDTGDCQTDCHWNGSCDKHCTRNKFVAPPGLSSLNGTSFGGITTKDLIVG